MERGGKRTRKPANIKSDRDEAYSIQDFEDYQIKYQHHQDEQWEIRKQG
jgi:hypothetical protein